MGARSTGQGYPSPVASRASGLLAKSALKARGKGANRQRSDGRKRSGETRYLAAERAAVTSARASSVLPKKTELAVIQYAPVNTWSWPTWPLVLKYAASPSPDAAVPLAAAALSAARSDAAGCAMLTEVIAPLLLLTRPQEIPLNDSAVAPSLPAAGL